MSFCFLLFGILVATVCQASSGGNWTGTTTGRSLGGSDISYKILGPTQIFSKEELKASYGVFRPIRTIVESVRPKIPSAVYFMGYSKPYADPALLEPEVRTLLAENPEALHIVEEGGIEKIYRRAWTDLEEKGEASSGRVVVSASPKRWSPPNLTAHSTRSATILDMARSGANVRIVVFEGDADVYVELIRLWMEAQVQLFQEGAGQIQIDFIIGTKREKPDSDYEWQASTDGAEFIARHFGLATEGPITGRVYCLDPRGSFGGPKSSTGLENISNRYPAVPTEDFAAAIRPGELGFRLTPRVLRLAVSDMVQLAGPLEVSLVHEKKRNPVNVVELSSPTAEWLARGNAIIEAESIGIKMIEFRIGRVDGGAVSREISLANAAIRAQKAKLDVSLHLHNKYRSRQWNLFQADDMALMRALRLKPLR